MFELLSYVVGFQPQCIADRQEGKEPARVIFEEPILSLSRALHRLRRFKLLMKAEKCVFEHSIHQGGLRAHRGELDSCVEELFGKRRSL